MDIESIYEDDGLWIGVINDLVIAIWDCAPTVAQMVALDAARARLLKPYVFVNVVYGGIPKFSDDLRRALRETMENAGGRRALAHVVVMPGLAGTAVRAFLSTSILMKQGTSTTKVFDSIDKSSRWIAEKLNTETESRWTPGRVEAAFDLYRDEMIRTMGAPAARTSVV